MYKIKGNLVRALKAESFNDVAGMKIISYFIVLRCAN